VISKGGGNFETLSEGMPEEKHVTFILLSKCRIFDHHFSVPRNSPILVNMVRHLPEKDSEEETSQEKNGG
jgi:uncharacterized protein with ATP-grasp and redox domains